MMPLMSVRAYLTSVASELMKLIMWKSVLINFSIASLLALSSRNSLCYSLFMFKKFLIASPEPPWSWPEVS